MRSPLYEQIFEKQGVNWTYLPSLEVKAIDAHAGLKNQARLDNPVDQELIEQYEIMSQSGSEPPAVVVYKRKNRPIWVPIDGNQRIVVATRLKKKCIDAYQVNSEDQRTLDRLTWAFNNLANGKRLTREESIEHAVTMVQKYGDDIKVAAKEFGIPPRAVSKRITTSKLRDLLRARGASQASQLSDDKLEELNSLAVIGEEVFTEAAVTTYTCGLTLADIMEMKQEVSSAKTQDAKRQVVTDFGQSPTAQQRRAETKGGTVKPKTYGKQPCEEMYYLAKKMNRLFDEYDKAALRRKGVGYKEFLELMREVADKMILTYGLGGRLNTNGSVPEPVEVG